MKRRRFLQVAGVAGAGLAAGCTSDTGDRLLPYLVPSDDLIPGIPTYYASTCGECPAGCGVLVKTREGRAVKVEGNPLHPVNRGRLCARGQAALQGLYDPDRIDRPYRRTARGLEPISWDQAMAQIAEALGAAAAGGPDRVALITGAESGALDALYNRFCAAFRSSYHVRYEAFAYEPLREANLLTFGVSSIPRYDFGAAQYVLSFGADFLETWISPVEYARGFAESHGYREGTMARFVAVEPRRGLTGFNADEWVAPRPGTEGLLALAIAASLVRQGRSRVRGAEADRLRGFLPRFGARNAAEATGVAEAVIDRLAREFTDASPSLAVAGGVAHQHRAATQTAVAVNLLNYLAGNVGRTVVFAAASAWDRVARYRDLDEVVAAMDAGHIDVAFVNGANPAFTVPRSRDFAAAYRKVGLKVAFASHLDETASLSDLLLPDHTPIERWGEAEPVAGVRGIVQPAMTPCLDTRQCADVLLAIAQQAGKTVARVGAASARDLVQAGRPERAFDTLVQHGGEFGAVAAKPVRLVNDFVRLKYQPPAFDGDADGMVLVVYPSATLFDGRGANKGWLQELPDVAAKITWQTWVEVHPETAARLGVVSGDVVRVTSPHGTVEVPAYVYPGVRRDVVAMPIGQGHTAYGRSAKDRGANPLDLLAAEATDVSGGLAFCSTRVRLTKTGRRLPLATTEGSARQHDRGIARAVTLADAAAGKFGGADEHGPTETELAAVAAAAASQATRRDLGVYGKPQPKWELTIDLARCTGCSACVTACYAENNLAVVGESQVVRSREMSWIRLERYYEGDTAGTDWSVAQVPMLCQQCANAPCEPVCPVYAAYHTPDGLNGQVYNRCVGTRYCANNCPYKVRYFNFWDYSDPDAPHPSWPGTLTWLLNPDVTVRTKGVMEKCTFCVQRIRFAQNTAKALQRDPLDGEIVPACAQTCPSDAIVFGNANDPASRVAHAKADARGYGVFASLNTRPGVTYLQRVIHGGEG